MRMQATTSSEQECTIGLKAEWLGGLETSHGGVPFKVGGSFDRSTKRRIHQELLTVLYLCFTHF